MKGIEAVIRKALSKPGMADPLQRERVYASARKALADGLEKQGLGGSQRARRQAAVLEELIDGIEDTYWAEPPPPDLGFALDETEPREPESVRPQPSSWVQKAHRPEAQPAGRPAPAASGHEPDFDDIPVPPRPKPSDPAFEDLLSPPEAEPGGTAPSEEPDEIVPPVSDDVFQAAPRRPDPVEIEVPVDPPETDSGPHPERPAPRRERPLEPQVPPPDDLVADAELGPLEPPPRHGERGQKRRRPIFSLILVTCLAIAFVGIGAVWLSVSGLLQTPQQRDTSVPNPPATVDAEDFAGLPSPDGAFSGDWIDVFVPSDLATVAGGEAADLSLLDNDSRDALRVVSRDGGAGGEALFELGPGLLQSLAGNRAMVAVTLRSSGDQPTQIYLRCELPGGGDCGRHRFDVTYEAGDVIFSFDLADAGVATRPGYLALNSDITGAGNGVDIYGIRIRPQ